jgi:hypothetical protein
MTQSKWAQGASLSLFVATTFWAGGCSDGDDTSSGDGDVEAESGGNPGDGDGDSSLGGARAVGGSQGVGGTPASGGGEGEGGFFGASRCEADLLLCDGFEDTTIDEDLWTLVVDEQNTLEITTQRAARGAQRPSSGRRQW